MNLIGGRCDRKWRFSKRETAFAGVQNFVRGDVDENHHFIDGKLVAHYQRCFARNTFFLTNSESFVEFSVCDVVKVMNVGCVTFPFSR